MSSNIGYQCIFPGLNTVDTCNKIYMHKGRLLLHMKSCHPNANADNTDQYIQTIDISNKPTNSAAKKRKQPTTSSNTSNTKETTLTPVTINSIVDDKKDAKKNKINSSEDSLEKKLIKELKETVGQLANQIKTIERRLTDVEKKDKKLCIACWEYESTFALQPCGHKLLCGTCAATMLHSHPQCPFCRTKVTDIIQIWDVAMNENDGDIALF